ncbi:MAG TPA: hypothetical protein VFA85_04550 [Terriglobales bacterium]|nr:hypothetical protein [Terriglobales bacterium]
MISVRITGAVLLSLLAFASLARDPDRRAEYLPFAFQSCHDVRPESG